MSPRVHFSTAQVMHRVKNAEVKHKSGHCRPCSDSNKPLELKAEAHSMPSSYSKPGLIDSFSRKLSVGTCFGLYPWIAKILDLRKTKLGQQEQWATYE